jgi:hypothetical protein
VEAPFTRILIGFGSGLGIAVSLQAGLRQPRRRRGDLASSRLAAHSPCFPLQRVVAGAVAVLGM